MKWFKVVIDCGNVEEGEAMKGFKTKPYSYVVGMILNYVGLSSRKQ